jgi:hypothetical protein
MRSDLIILSIGVGLLAVWYYTSTVTNMSTWKVMTFPYEPSATMGDNRLEETTVVDPKLRCLQRGCPSVNRT